MTAASGGDETGRMTDDQFATACAILAGTHDISPPFMAEARRALQAALGSDAIDALVAAVTTGKALSPLLEGIARQLLTILYTGQIDLWGTGKPSSFYTSGLAWQLLKFASAPGICGSGDWSKAPAA